MWEFKRIIEERRFANNFVKEIEIPHKDFAHLIMICIKVGKDKYVYMNGFYRKLTTHLSL